MTNEEAIEYWEQFNAEIDDLYDACSDADRDVLVKQREIVEYTISALRQQECVGDVNKSLTLDELSERNAPVFCQSKIFRMVGIGVCAKTDTSFLQVDTDLWQKRDQTGCFTARSRRRGRYEEYQMPKLFLLPERMV